MEEVPPPVNLEGEMWKDYHIYLSSYSTKNIQKTKQLMQPYFDHGQKNYRAWNIVKWFIFFQHSNQYMLVWIGKPGRFQVIATPSERCHGLQANNVWWTQNQNLQEFKERFYDRIGTWYSENFSDSKQNLVPSGAKKEHFTWINGQGHSTVSLIMICPLTCN